MSLRQLLKVIYAPQKAFAEIIKEPKYLGSLLVMLLFVGAQVGFYYAVASRSYFELTTPSLNEMDAWTEDAKLWTGNPGISIIDNNDDYIYGNSSVEFSISDSNYVIAELETFDSVDCGADGYNNLSIRIRILAPEIKPENVTIFLYSLNSSNFFYRDISEEFSVDSATLWNNITIPIGTGDWSSSEASARWENITGLKLEFVWPTASLISLRLDGLFFRGNFQTLIEIGGNEYLAAFTFTAFTEFIFNWILLAALMYLLIRLLKGQLVWKPLMVAVGIALLPLVFYTLISIVTYSSVSSLVYPLELSAGIPGEAELISQVNLESLALVTQIGALIQGVAYAWTVALCAIITRTLSEFSWMKSLIISAASFLLMILLVSLILGL